MDRDHIFYRVINGVLRLLLAGVVFLLLLHSLFSTSFVGRLILEDGSHRERTLNIADSPLRHLFVFMLLSVVLVAGKRLASRGRERTSGDNVREKGRGTRRGEGAFWGLILFTLFLGTAYVLLTKLQPGSDPAKVYEVAMQWRRGDFSAFEVEGYLFRYPFQSGIVLFFYLQSFLFGMDSYVGPQIVNVVCLAVIYGLLTKQFFLFASLGKGERPKGGQTAVYLGMLFWVPFAFYVTYLYGILPGMALSLGAVYFAGRYLVTRRYRYMAAASVCMGLATVIKMNCLIYLIAIACFLVWDAVEQFFFAEKKEWKRGVLSLLLIACMGLSVALCTQLTNHLTERITGQELGEGEAMLAWVVMGMQEAPLGPGGYNGYNSEVFTENQYDTEKVTAACREDLQKIVTRMSENPLDEGIPFFARKTAFQWNDPTFICLDRTRGRSSDTDIPLWLKSLISGKGSVGLSVLLNYAQTLILLGVLLFFLLRWKKGSLYELMGAVIFLGGYLFHMIWESSASYTIPYFVLLLPYAVSGLAEWAACLESVPERIREGMRFGKKDAAAVVLAAVFVLLLAAFLRTNLFDRTIALNDDANGIDASAQFYQTGEWSRDY